MSREIETRIAAEDWDGARALINAALRREPDSHWLLTRLSLTYYEQRRYKRALKVSERAIALAPDCPLVLWDHAGTLEMLGCYKEALNIFRHLIRRGVELIAFGTCGEGRGRARGLVADCHYRAAHCLDRIGRASDALSAFEAHLDMRGPGCFSIYPLKVVAKEVKHLRGARPNNRMHATRSEARA